MLSRFIDAANVTSTALRPRVRPEDPSGRGRFRFVQLFFGPQPILSAVPVETAAFLEYLVGSLSDFFLIRRSCHGVQSKQQECRRLYSGFGQIDGLEPGLLMQVDDYAVQNTFEFQQREGRIINDLPAAS